jgi:hypothetical protein
MNMNVSNVILDQKKNECMSGTHTVPSGSLLAIVVDVDT